MAKKKISLNLEFLTEVQGNPKGRFLFSVVTVDQSDTEDSITTIWRANNEYELSDLVKKEYCGDEEDAFYEEIGQQFDDDWGFNILPTKLAKIK